MLEVHFFEPLYPCEDKMGIKKQFHFCPSEIAASLHGQSSLDGPVRPCTLAAISEGQKWKTFLMLILSSHGIEVQKSALPTLFNFDRVRAASQPHVYRNRAGECMMLGTNLRTPNLQSTYYNIELYLLLLQRR